MEKMNKRLLIATLLIASCLISIFVALNLTQPVGASPNPIVLLDPSHIVIPFCHTKKTTVCIENFTDLYAFQFQIWWLKNSANLTSYEWRDPPPGWEDFVLASPGYMENATHKAVVLGIAATGMNASTYLGRWPFINLFWHCITPDLSTPLVFDRIQTYLLDDNLEDIPIHMLVDGYIVNVPAPLEPVKLIDLVEFPYTYHLTDLPFIAPASPAGFPDLRDLIEDKGYYFIEGIGGSRSQVDIYVSYWEDWSSDDGNETDPEKMAYGIVTSWWSANTLEDGTRACLLTFESNDTDDPGMAMGFITNLLPPEQIPEVDPYIIHNAEPYFFINFYWYAWSHDTVPGRIVTFPYWWHDSHNHPNWFWGPYWWWRCYTRSYFYPYEDVPYWRSWWGWWWHWLYWKHWYWWSTQFPYDP